MTGRVAHTRRVTSDLEEVPQPTLDLMERQMIAALYAIWTAQGVKKKIIRVESNGHFPDIEEMVKDGQ